MTYPDDIVEHALEIDYRISSEQAVKMLHRKLPFINESFGYEKYTHSDIPSARTLRTWRKENIKEKSIAKHDNAIEKQEKDVSQRSLTQQQKEHYDQLADVARRIIGNIGHIQQVGNRRYRVYGLHNIPELVLGTMTYNQLVDLLRDNMIATLNQNSTLSKCLLDHIKAEKVKVQDISEYAEESPKELFEYLQLLSMRKTFQGKCDICKDW